jgi:CAAX protease family protein
MSELKEKWEAAATAIGVTIATTIVMRFVFDPARAGKPAMLIALGLLYAMCAAVALQRLHRRGVLYGAAQLVMAAFAPHGSPREAWVIRLYLQLGDPEALERELVSAAVFLVAALEEVTWRGLVMRSLEVGYGTRWALVASALLFGAAHVPTMFLLSDPVAGLNPLIVLAAVGCGLVWGAMFWRTSRLLPAIFAHAFFSWAIVEIPIWRP